MFGYDGVLSIEDEDRLLSPEEDLPVQHGSYNDIVLKKKPVAAWWV
jgi:hypothetical protein